MKKIILSALYPSRAYTSLILQSMLPYAHISVDKVHIYLQHLRGAVPDPLSEHPAVRSGELYSIASFNFHIRPRHRRCCRILATFGPKELTTAARCLTLRPSLTFVSPLYSTAVMDRGDRRGELMEEPDAANFLERNSHKVNYIYGQQALGNQH